ncbi:MAG: saccharopine dehydrogenase NADP-binding domain-containing protein [Deltaproteobacteria bacterium]|uniref:saccharopine dehydrogenase C-terminal domain-containing protein n=1 Tax=Desulfobacula sp. TaxID=2593537 RepID=UPI00199E668A|nr:saccharopine dehydrogenase NADP-binding domain-containing protein [Candidatus Desulfobacula maris]MBL6992684.1 saccharopine dehydrogenase NADP-binding domain-containing protein [Desulfobacula sp.]
MKKIAVLGSGFVTKPAVDYFLDKCGYEVTLTSIKKDEAEKLINNRPKGNAVAWTIDQLDLLDKIVSNADLVMSMIPPLMHIPVAKACLKHKTNMVTTSYISPQMDELHTEAQKKYILILNEIGEDPGLDNMGAKQMIDEVKAQNGKVISLRSYGAGLPSFEHNNNPFGYKFSWSPMGVILAARTPAVYLEKGEKIDVPAKELFQHPGSVNLEGIGRFETYPNRDCRGYVKHFGLDDDVSIYRGVLRFPGWCSIMNALIALNLLDNTREKEFKETSYAQFTASLMEADSGDDILQRAVDFLKMEKDSDSIEKLRWLGLFDDSQITISRGTNADVLVDLMLKKMSYGRDEKDMVIVANEIIAQFQDQREKRSCTMLVTGIPGGDSAMSRAVSLPAAIASKLILNGKIKAKGVHRPLSSEIYIPVLKEMKDLGLYFKRKTIKL